MKTETLLGLFLWIAAVTAASSASYNTSPVSIDAGGARATSANYALDGSSVGGIGGISASASYTARHGYSGQLFEVTNITVNAVSTNLNETVSVALNPQASLSDGTKLSPAVIHWVISGAIDSVSSTGLVTAASVYTNTLGTVSGGLGSLSVSRNFLVLDVNPDNFGLYANDGIQDGWQVAYFGLNNQAATGASALFAYTAGLNPTNPASMFALSLTNAAGQSQHKVLTFSPRYTNRTYKVEYADRLNQTFSNLTLATVIDNGTVRTVTDTNPSKVSRFYRVQINYP